jgi:hypothetical protein
MMTLTVLFNQRFRLLKLLLHFRDELNEAFQFGMGQLNKKQKKEESDDEEED